MKKMKSILSLAMAVLFVAGMHMTLQAQNKACCDKSGKGQSCQQDGKSCKIPDLTKDQQKQIDELKTALIKDRISFKNQIEEKKAHLKTLAMADQADMNAINKTVDELYALKAEFAKKKEAHIQAVRKILNDEQRLYFDLKHSKMGGHGDGNCGHTSDCCPQKGSGCQQQSGQGCGSGAGKGCGQHQQGSGDGKGCGQHQQGSGDGKGCGQHQQGSGNGKGCGQKTDTK